MTPRDQLCIIVHGDLISLPVEEYLRRTSLPDPGSPTKSEAASKELPTKGRILVKQRVGPSGGRGVEVVGTSIFAVPPPGPASCTSPLTPSSVGSFSADSSAVVPPSSGFVATVMASLSHLNSNAAVNAADMLVLAVEVYFQRPSTDEWVPTASGVLELGKVSTPTAAGATSDILVLGQPLAMEDDDLPTLATSVVLLMALDAQHGGHHPHGASHSATEHINIVAEAMFRYNARKVLPQELSMYRGAMADLMLEAESEKERGGGGGGATTNANPSKEQHVDPLGSSSSRLSPTNAEESVLSSSMSMNGVMAPVLLSSAVVAMMSVRSLRLHVELLQRSLVALGGKRVKHHRVSLAEHVKDIHTETPNAKMNASRPGSTSRPASRSSSAASKATKGPSRSTSVCDTARGKTDGSTGSSTTPKTKAVNCSTTVTAAMSRLGGAPRREIEIPPTPVSTQEYPLSAGSIDTDEIEALKVQRQKLLVRPLSVGRRAMPGVSAVVTPGRTTGSSNTNARTPSAGGTRLLTLWDKPVPKRESATSTTTLGVRTPVKLAANANRPITATRTVAAEQPAAIPVHRSPSQQQQQQAFVRSDSSLRDVTPSK